MAPSVAQLRYQLTATQFVRVSKIWPQNKLLELICIIQGLLYWCIFHEIIWVKIWTGEGRWFIIFQIFVHFVFCQLNFIVLFPFFIKYYHILFNIIVFWLGCDRPSGLFLFVLALQLSILTSLFLLYSSVSLSYFVLAVPMHERLGKHSCMSSPCPIVNGTFLFREAK